MNSTFNCELCPKGYKWRNNLTKHLKQKSNIEPSRAMTYICNVCNQTFTTRYDLKRHQKRLHRSRISCNSCDLQFVDENELTQHQKVHRVTADNQSARSCEKDYDLVESTRKKYLKVLSLLQKYDVRPNDFPRPIF